MIALRHDTRVTSAAFSPDGAKVVTGSYDSTARVWDAKTGAELRVLRGHTGRLGGASFSVDGSTILTVGLDGARLWDARAGEPGVRVVKLERRELLVTALQGPDRRALSPLVSPDGTRFVNGGYDDNTARVLDAQTNAVLLTLKGHTQRVMTGTFSPDGSRIATADSGGTGRVWDARSGTELAVLRGVSATDSPPLSSRRTGRGWHSCAGMRARCVTPTPGLTTSPSRATPVGCALPCTHRMGRGW